MADLFHELQSLARVSAALDAQTSRARRVAGQLQNDIRGGRGVTITHESMQHTITRLDQARQRVAELTALVRLGGTP